jgi:hypothetical protein
LAYALLSDLRNRSIARIHIATDFIIPPYIPYMKKMLTLNKNTWRL